MHAKAHASGLNLVNATHVFLCEPLINTALELQAIARVHRIGQQRETTVWMYLISDSVEESIYQISVSRRLAHIVQKQKAANSTSRTKEVNGLDLANLTEKVIDAANSLELEGVTLGTLMSGRSVEGENVKDDDLWQCLFGKAKKTGSTNGAGSENMGLVDRMLRAEAAEARMEVDRD